jgi:hypothetical protein
MDKLYTGLSPACQEKKHCFPLQLCIIRVTRRMADSLKRQGFQEVGAGEMISVLGFDDSAGV